MQTQRLYEEYRNLRDAGSTKRGAAKVLSDKYGLSLHPTRRRMNEYEKKRFKSDLQKWADTLATLRRQNYVVVNHQCDIHAPFADRQALALDYQIVKYMQPHVIVVGSDFADFPTISAYSPDPELDDDDILDNLRPHWWAHIDALNAAAPNAIKVWISGNHEDRLWRYIDETAPQIRNTTREAFVDLIRYQGNVLYLGRIAEIDVGPLTVLHGDSSCIGDMAARKLLTARRFQRSYMFGHNHKDTNYTTSGQEKIVRSAGSGHLSQRIPHYQKGVKYNHWVQGNCYGLVDFRGAHVDFENIVFWMDKKVMRANVGIQRFEQKAA